MSMERMLDDGRAKFAYDCVVEAKSKLQGEAILKYKSYAKKVPMLIKTNGLGPTAAFMYSKSKSDESKKDPWWLIYSQLTEWITIQEILSSQERNGSRGYTDSKTPVCQGIADDLTRVDSHEYRLATREALALLNWLRRFAEGMIEGEDHE